MANKPNIQPIRLRQKFVKGVIYGEPGTGKTPLIGTAPNALILDADVGTESAAIAGSTADVWPVDSHNDLLEAHEYLREEDHSYEWVCLDTGTTMQELGMDDLMQQLIVRKPERNQYIPDQPQYLENMNRILNWVRYMKALPINFIITAHVMRFEEEDEDENEIVTYMPAFSGKKQGIPIASHICAQMNLVGHLKIVKKTVDGKKKKVQVLTCERKGHYYAKDRWGVVGTMTNPSIPKIMDKIGPLIAEASKSSKKKSVKKKRRKV